MAHIKKMVVYGFKSFAKKTEIPLDKEINLFIGANGSGKSNVAESILFALGRLSIKSMRAAKSKNLIFMGSKYIKPAKEAFVELVFDNNDKSFNIGEDELSLKRIVRQNGQSIYKINGETKTRGEVIEMLAQAGIDPYGFNLVMQGQIQSIVRMHSEERRKIIEEVAGISIYESRKEKSLKELEKTEERLKEISTILRERTAYLRNLEREKAQAQRYKDAELTVKRAKASILNKKKKDKERELDSVLKSISDKEGIKDKEKETIEKFQGEIDSFSEKINGINKNIQKSSGIEQESLNENIANLKAEIEGLKVRSENYENRKDEIERRILELKTGIPELEKEIEELRKESPLVAKKSDELKKKKDELAEIERERKRLLGLKSELEHLGERILDKEKHKARVENDSDTILKRLAEMETGLKHNDEKDCLNSLNKLRLVLKGLKHDYSQFHQKELEHEKSISAFDAIIKSTMNIKKSVSEVDICPICQSKITDKHKKHVHADADSQIEKIENEKKNAIIELEKTRSLRAKISNEISKIELELSNFESEFLNHKHISEKKLQLKQIIDDEKMLEDDIRLLTEKRKKLESMSENLGKLEERYERKMHEIEEISSRTTEDINTALLYKERDLEGMKNVIKRAEEDSEEIESDVDDISAKLESKTQDLEEKENQEKILNEKFKRLFEERDLIQKNIQEKSLNLSEKRNELRGIEDQINYLKIGKAKLDAENEALEMELSDFAGIELMQGSAQILEEKLKKSKEIVQNIGAINLRALEVYEQVKAEYDKVNQKVETLQNEKDEVLKIIEEIDKKKKKSFMNTFKAINDLFSSNFSKLSSKGVAYLDIDNKEDMFSGGISIVVKLAKGKYFDVSSLSGGEQTLVALSLLFAIQEHKPYHFYIFDEIDAALDKRNSERLAGLLNQYMKSGQYIMISHNDALITNSNVLYGVSMHEGVSKVLSLRV